MNRTEEFIGRCLRDVPPGRYRRRADAELKDHMECQRQVSTEAETLEAMGDPEQLRREYYAAWSRTLPGRVNLIVNCYLLIWGVTFLSAGLLEALRLGGKPAWLIGLYLVPFTLGAAFLGACLRGERRRALGVTLALLAEWVLTNLTFSFCPFGFTTSPGSWRTCCAGPRPTCC